MSILKNQDLTKIYDDAQFSLGEVVEVNQRKYRFVKYNSGAGSVSGVAGQLVYYVGTGTTGMVPFEVTMDYDSNAAATAITCPNAAAGFLQAALTDGKYGWAQITGRNSIAALTDGTITVGGRVMISSTDGAITIFADAAPPLEVLGTALAADTAANALAAGNLMIKIGE